jgi:hypothetical protein
MFNIKGIIPYIRDGIIRLFWILMLRYDLKTNGDNMDNVINLSTKIKEKDLEKLVHQLTQKTFDLMIINQELALQLAHLEDLLRHAPVQLVEKK